MTAYKTRIKECRKLMTIRWYEVLMLFLRLCRRQAISNDESLDDIESGSHNDRRSDKMDEKSSEKQTSKHVNTGEMCSLEENLIRKDSIAKESQNASERESYPKFVTLFTVGVKNVSKPSKTTRNTATRSKSVKDTKKPKTTEIKRHETFCVPLKSNDTTSEKVTRSDSMINTFKDRSKQPDDLKNLSDNLEKSSANSIVRKPSRCWEDLSAEISDMNNLEDNDTDESHADDYHLKTKKCESSKDSTSDNMSYVVDPINKTFVQSEKAKIVNKRDSDTSSWGSEHTDVTAEDGDSFASVTLSDFESSGNSSEIKTIFKVKSVEPHDSPTSVLSKTDEQNMNRRPQTAQSTEQIEHKKSTTLYRCKSIPSNARLNYSTNINNLQYSQTNGNASGKSPTKDNNLFYIKLPVANDSTEPVAKGYIFFPKSNVSTFATAELNVKELKPLDESSGESFADKQGNFVNDFQTKENLKLSEFHEQGESSTATNLQNKCRENIATTESTVSDGKFVDSTVFWKPAPQKFKQGDAQNDMEGITSKSLSETADKLQERPPVLPSQTQKSSQTNSVYKSDWTNATLSLRQEISEKQMLKSRPRKRKFSELRAPTPIPTSDAKPQRGILKKTCGRKLTLQVIIPDEKDTIAENEEITQESLNHIQKDICDQNNTSDSQQIFNSKTTVQNNVILPDENSPTEIRTEKQLTTTEKSISATPATLSTITESKDRNCVTVTEESSNSSSEILHENKDDEHRPFQRKTHTTVNEQEISGVMQTNLHPLLRSKSPILSSGYGVNIKNIKTSSLSNHPDDSSVEDVRAESVTQMSSYHSLDTRLHSGGIAREFIGTNVKSTDMIEQNDKSTTESNTTILQADPTVKNGNEVHNIIRDVAENNEIVCLENVAELATKDMKTVILQQCNEVTKRQTVIDHENDNSRSTIAERHENGSLDGLENDLHEDKYNRCSLDFDGKENIKSVKDKGSKRHENKAPEGTNIQDENQQNDDECVRHRSDNFSKSYKTRDLTGKMIKRTDSYHTIQVQTAKKHSECLELKGGVQEKEIGNNSVSKFDASRPLSMLREPLKDDVYVKTGCISIIGHQAPSKLTDIEGTDYNTTDRKDVSVNFLTDKDEPVFVQKFHLSKSNLPSHRFSSVSVKTSIIGNHNSDMNNSNAGPPALFSNGMDMADRPAYQGNITGKEKRSKKKRRSKSLPGNASEQGGETKTKLQRRVSSYRGIVPQSKIGQPSTTVSNSPESVPFHSGYTVTRDNDLIKPINSRNFSYTTTDLELPSTVVGLSIMNSLNSDNYEHEKSAIDTIAIDKVSEANISGKTGSAEMNKNGIMVYDDKKLMVRGSGVSASITHSLPNDDNVFTPTDNDYLNVRSNRPKSAKGRSRNELETTTVTVSELEETDKSKLSAQQPSIPSNIGLKRNETFRTRLERRDDRKSVSRSKSVGQPEKVSAKTSSKPSKQCGKSMTFENDSFLTNRSRFGYLDQNAENDGERINFGISSQSNNFDHEKYISKDKLISESNTKTDDILKDGILYSVKPSMRERPKSSYGRSMSRPENDTKDRLLRRRPTSASDLATSRRANLTRTKYSPHYVSYSVLDDTLSDPGNSSDSLEEVKLLDSSSISRSSKSLAKNRQYHLSKTPSYSLFDDDGQTISIEKENRPFEKRTLKQENDFLQDKDGRMQVEIKRSSSLYESRNSGQKLHPSQRSATPVPKSRSIQGELDSVNKTLRKTLGGLKSPTTSFSHSNSIADRIRGRMTSTNPNQSFQGVQGHLSKEFSGRVIPRVNTQHRLLRSKTIGVGDKYIRQSANDTNRHADFYGATDTARDFLHKYKTQDVMTALTMKSATEQLKERNRYSHNMRSKSFRVN